MSGKPAVLVVDDEAKILELIKSYLETSGYTPLCAKTGREGLALFEQSRGPDQISLILLDLMLPDLPGEIFCRRVREVSDIPIIMITAKVDEESIVRGLNIGADDYVCKPFSPRQLMARVDAVLRRTGEGNHRDRQGSPGHILEYDGLKVDTEQRIVRLVPGKGGEKEKTLTLTRDEYNILTLLMSRRAKIFTRDEILEAIKGEDYEGFDRSVDTHIKNLRAKIGDDPRSPEYIITVYGMGYRFGGSP
jgi:DNA-binding response OmpR family regulator